MAVKSLNNRLLNFTVITRFVHPVGRPEQAPGAEDSEQKLAKLTDFIAFLEK